MDEGELFSLFPKNRKYKTAETDEKSFCSKTNIFWTINKTVIFLTRSNRCIPESFRTERNFGAGREEQKSPQKILLLITFHFSQNSNYGKGF